MRLHFVTKPRRQDKAPKFIPAHLVLACASLAFGALAVGGWFLAYYETSIWLAGFLSTLSLGFCTGRACHGWRIRYRKRMG
jgi:hypothetical protein